MKLDENVCLGRTKLLLHLMTLKKKWRFRGNSKVQNSVERCKETLKKTRTMRGNQVLEFHS